MGKDEPVDFDDYFSTGTKGLETVGSNYIKEKYFAEEKEPPSYENRIPIGREKDTGQIKWIKLEDDDRYGIFGRTGAGKTFLMKTILSRAYIGGFKVLHLSDVKNDFAEIEHGNGIQKHHMNLLENEERKPIPVNMFMPAFLGDEYFNGPPQRDNFHPFTFALHELSESDFLELMGADSTGKKNIARALYDYINDKDEGEQTAFSELYQKIEGMDDANAMSKRSIKSTLETLERQKVLSNQYQKRPVEFIDEGVIGLAFEHWDKFKRKSIEKLEIYISITIRQVLDGLRNKEIEPPVCMVIDEAHAFVPDSRNSISKDDVVDVIDLGRAYGIPMIFASQRLSQLPENDVVDQMNKFFISKTSSPDEKREVLKQAGIYESGDAQRNKWTRIFRKMEQYDWMYVDAQKGEWTIIETLSPLCKHG